MNNLISLKKISKNYILNNQRIIILGDYDVDGITATAMMIEFLKKCGVKNLDFFIIFGGCRSILTQHGGKNRLKNCLSVASYWPLRGPPIGPCSDPR